MRSNYLNPSHVNVNSGNYGTGHSAGKGDIFFDYKTEEVKDGYEKTWDVFLEKVQSLIDQGERNLSNILNILIRKAEESAIMSAREEYIANMLNFPRNERNIPISRLVVADGKYVSIPRHHTDNTLIAAVTSRITEDTDLMVELGSGWGKNLFLIYLQGLFKQLQYVACEPTKSGRCATEILGSLEKDMRVTTRHFDFYDPDMSFIEGKPNVVFFTNHSIEQCIRFNNHVYDMMLEKSGQCTCIHMEPIGWQRHPQSEAIKKMIAENKTPKEMPIKISNEELLENSMAWAGLFRYNTNLLETIQHYQESGVIDVEVIQYDIFGINPFNPSSLIVWHKK